jgi:UPF0176 protein
MPQLDPNYQVLLFYKYIKLEYPVRVEKWFRKLCLKYGATGRTIVAEEGINSTVELKTELVDDFLKEFFSDPRFEGTKIKRTMGTGKSFPKLSVKTRSEIVTSKLPEDQKGSPLTITGKYLEADELHQWFLQKKEFYIVDMRNDYEHKVGHFEGSILPSELKNFRDLPKILPKLEKLKDKTIVTVCTYGIRCEVASGFLLKHGFKDVYQLKDGIGTYMEKYPNQHFKGKLFVFDNRVTIGFNTDSEEHEIIGKCDICGASSENYVDYYLSDGLRRFGIVCPECIKNHKVKLDSSPKVAINQKQLEI